MTCWAISIPDTRRHGAFVLAAGCMTAWSELVTWNPEKVTCKVCKCLPSYKRALGRPVTAPARELGSARHLRIVH